MDLTKLSLSRRAATPPGYSDHVFKVAHGVEIPLRIWPAPRSPKAAPWLLWIHGGGYITGKHIKPNTWVVPAFHGHGYHVVSVAYRLMPQVQFCDSVQDCLDSLSWCRSHLPSILHGIDIDRYLVAGDSAGGTMSTVCGNLFDPTPKAVVDVFGVVDFTDEFFHVPHPPEHRYLRQYNKEELRQKLKDRDPKRAKVICPYDWELRALDGPMEVQQLQQLWGMPKYTPGEEEYIRVDMNKVLDEDGSRISTLLRKDTFSDDSEWQAEMKKWSAIHMVQAAGSYPPTFILHGTGDRVVPVEQSYRFSEKLKQLGVPVGEAYCPGGDHSFESEISGPEHPDWETYVVPCMEFVDRFVRG